jgi:IS66 C-terminal element
MGPQVFDLAVTLRGQPIHDVLEIGVGVEPVETGRLDRLMMAAARSEPAKSQLRLLCAVEHKRRNWLFSDTVAGANASTNLYSLLKTCQVNGIDGYRYLRELLVALPKASMADDYEALLPWRLTPRD